MRLFRPQSIQQLIVFGFALVVLPLIGALLYAAMSVDRLAAQSQQVIAHAVKATEGGRIMLEQITLMERNLRQYQVLGDAMLLQVYESNRVKLVETLFELSSLPLPDALRQQLETLRGDEAGFYERIHASTKVLRQVEVSQSFAQLAEQAQQVVSLSQRLIDAEMAKTLSSAEQTQQNLFWQVSVFVPFVLLLVAFLVLLISRPLRRLDDAIRRLGDGDFSAAIRLKGPRDLEQLGERLDWMRRRLMEVEEEKQRFLRHLSHELKTPLTSLREGSELLAEEIAGGLSPQQREIVELLRQNGLQLQRLIEDLLNYNAATRNLTLELQAVPMDELVSNVIADYKAVSLARQLQFDTDLAPLNVVADRDKLRIVIDNLLSNAVKFSPNQGRIKIKLSRKSDQAVLDVTDQGPGILPEQREQIFDAFFQGTAAYTSHVNGTGLGLSIVREYLHAHGGSVRVVADTQTGAHLRVSLPLRQAREAV